MPLGVRVSQAGGHRLISVCSLFKLHWAAEEIRILSFYPSFFFFTLSGFLRLIPSAFLLLLLHSHSLPHGHCFTQGQVWSLSCLTPPVCSPLSSLCFSPPVPTPPSTHPVVSIFRFSVSPTSSLTSLVSLSSECLSFVPQLSPISLVYRSHRLPIEILLFSHHSVFALPLSFSIPGTALSSPTFIPTFPAPTPLILHHFGIPRLSLLFHPSRTLPLSSFLPDSFPSPQTKGGKYGNVTVTERGIREDGVNMPSAVCVHIMWVLKT